MTEPVIRVTGELRYFTDRDVWEVNATGGGPVSEEFTVRLERPSEQEAKDAFVEAWNAAAGTEWAYEEFAWDRNWGEPGE